MSARIRRREKFARQQSAYRHFIATFEILERRELLAWVGPNPPLQSTSDVAQISDPTSCCGSSNTGSSFMQNPQTGNAVTSPPAMSGDSRSFTPRHSTNEFRPIVTQANAQFSQMTPVPTSLEVNSTSYTTTGVSGGERFFISDLFDTTSLAPGRYPWTLQVTEHYAIGPDVNYDADGFTLVPGPSNVLMSPGWHIPGIDRLTVTVDGALWQTEGDHLFWFTEDAGDYLRPDGDQDFSTLVDNLNGTFTITNRWGDTALFNSLGYVISKIDRDGRTTNFTYTDADSDSDNDDIIEIEAYDGRTLTYSYTNERISGITDFDGRVIAFSYDGDDQLQHITYEDPDDDGPADALVTTYAYITDTSYLSTIVDGGQTTTLTYDAAGALDTRTNRDDSVEDFDSFLTAPLLASNLTKVASAETTVEDGEGYITTYVLNSLGLPVTMIDALNNVTTYVRNADGRVTLEISPNPTGTDPSHETAYEYDPASGNLLEITLPNGATRTWTYDATWNIPDSYTDERGLLTLYTIDPGTGFVEETRQVIGNVDDEYNLEEDDIVTTNTYTVMPVYPEDPPAGLVATSTDPLGITTVYLYNARGDVTSITYADGTADEATVSFSYNTDGTLEYQLDELSRRTDFTYDLLGRLILKTLNDPDGGGPLGRPEISFQYDTWNRLIKQTDELGRETIYTHTFDDGYITTMERPDHDGDTKLTVTKTEYDGRGLPFRVTDPLGRVTETKFDALGRSESVMLPEVPDPTTAVNEIQIVDFDSGTEGTFKLNGNTKTGTIDLADTDNFQTVLDGLWGAGNTSVKVTATEATVTFRGDLAGNNISQMSISDITGTKGATPAVSTDTAGVAPDLVHPTTTTAYDEIGRIISSTDPLDSVTTFDWSDYGRELKITLPDPDGAGKLAAPILYQSFNDAGDLVSEKDANGGVTTRDYNILGQLIKITEPDPDAGGPLDAPSTTYQFDLAGNLRFVTDPLGNTTEMQYDDRHRQVKTISEDPDGAGGNPQFVTETTFDPASQVTKTTAPGNRETKYIYDGLGRNITTKDDSGNIISNYRYDAAGQLIGLSRPTGVEISYGYDALGNQIFELAQTGMPFDYNEFDYHDEPSLTYREYDAVGQLSSESHGRGNREIQRLRFGAKSGEEIPGDGTYVLTFDGESTTSLSYNADYNDVQSALAALPNIGEGNVLVAAAYRGFWIVFRNALQNQDLPEIVVTEDDLTTTSGMDAEADVTQSPALDVNEIQVLYLSATTGTFDIDGNSTSATVYTLDYAGIYNALDALFGSSNFSLTGGPNYYSITFTGANANQNMPQLEVSNNTTDGSPSFYTDTEGVTGQSEIIHVQLTGLVAPPTGGAWTLYYNSTPYEFDWDVTSTEISDAIYNSGGYPTYSVVGSNGNFTITGLYTPQGTFSADGSGTLIKEIDGEVEEVLPGLWDWWNTTTYSYDDLGRTIEVTSPDPDGFGGESPPNTKYSYSLTNNLVQVMDPLKHETNYLYDFLNRRTSSVDALAGETSFTYAAAGNLETLTDPENNTTTWVYDALNRVVDEENHLGDHRLFTYDAIGNLLQKQDRLDRFTVYSYDALGRQTREQWWADDVYPAVDVTTSTQGTTGVNEVQVVTLTNSTGGTFTLTFAGQTTAPLDWDATNTEVDTALEALANIDTVTVTGSAGGPFTITFTGSLALTNVAQLTTNSQELTNTDLLRTIAYAFNEEGELASVSDPSATYEFLYDNLGRVTNYVQNIAGLNPEIEFVSSYNAASRREVLQAVVDSTDDFKNIYSYDGMLRLQILRQQSPNSGNVIAPKRIEFNYNELSQYVRIDRYEHLGLSEFVASSHFQYDEANRLTKLVHSETTTAPTSGWGSNPLAGYEFAYDSSSRVASIDSYIDGLSEYTHDDTNQLVGADHNTADDEAYEYDANGNRVMSGYDIDPNNQLYSDGTYIYKYDAEGNRETRTKISNSYVTRYYWDHRNRMVKVEEYDAGETHLLSSVEQTYDPLNQWIRRSFDEDGTGGDPAVDTFFIYENGQIVLEFNGDEDTDLTHRYLWGEQVDQLFADESVTSLGSAGTVIWPLGDHLGTMRDLATYNSGTDDATVANHREYDSFGQLTNESNDAIDLLFGFTSRPLDDATDEQNNGNRWYEAPNGIWPSEDPIGFLGNDTNIRRYAMNSPLSFVDPFGLTTAIKDSHSLRFDIVNGRTWTLKPIGRFDVEMGFIVTCQADGYRVGEKSGSKVLKAHADDSWLDSIKITFEDIRKSTKRIHDDAVEFEFKGLIEEGSEGVVYGASAGGGIGAIVGAVAGFWFGAPTIVGTIPAGAAGGAAGLGAGSTAGGVAGAVMAYPFDHRYSAEIHVQYTAYADLNGNLMLERKIVKQDVRNSTFDSYNVKWRSSENWHD